MWVGLIEFCVHSREFSTLPLKNIYLAVTGACSEVGIGGMWRDFTTCKQASVIGTKSRALA